MAWRCRFLTARRSQHGRVIPLFDFHTVDDRGAVGEDVPRAVDERQRRERDEVRAGALREGVDGEPSHSEAVHF